MVSSVINTVGAKMKKYLKNLILRRGQKSQKQIFLRPQHTLSIHLIEHLLGVNLQKVFPTPRLALIAVISQKQLERRSRAAFR